MRYEYIKTKKVKNSFAFVDIKDVCEKEKYTETIKELEEYNYA